MNDHLRERLLLAAALGLVLRWAVIGSIAMALSLNSSGQSGPVTRIPPTDEECLTLQPGPKPLSFPLENARCKSRWAIESTGSGSACWTERFETGLVFRSEGGGGERQEARGTHGTWQAMHVQPRHRCAHAAKANARTHSKWRPQPPTSNTKHGCRRILNAVGGALCSVADRNPRGEGQGAGRGGGVAKLFGAVGVIFELPISF